MLQHTIALIGVGMTSGGVVRTAGAGTGIVAGDDGGTRAGAVDPPLPFP